MDDCGTLVLLSRVANLPYKGGAQTVCNTLTAKKGRKTAFGLAVICFLVYACLYLVGRRLSVSPFSLTGRICSESFVNILQPRTWKKLLWMNWKALPWEDGLSQREAHFSGMRQPRLDSTHFQLLADLDRILMFQLSIVSIIIRFLL